MTHTMADALSPELFKKISALKNLRDAIGEVREHIDRESNLKKDNEIVPMMRSEEQKPATGNLKYLGKRNYRAGKMTYVIGVDDPSSPHYEVTVDSHRMGKAPHVSAVKLGNNGGLISRNPQMYYTPEDAIRSVKGHYRTGSWS